MHVACNLYVLQCRDVIAVNKRKANSGFINIHANACWLNSVLQLLELSDIPVFLEGLYNHINAIHIAYCIIVGFSDESLSVMQREYRNIHRELDEATTPVDCLSSFGKINVHFRAYNSYNSDIYLA